LSGNCDEFIFYDDLVREQKITRKPIDKIDKKSSSTKDSTVVTKRQEALDLIVETLQGLVAERGDEEKMWGSMVKQTMKRRHPGFSESYYGYRSFRELVEDAQKLGLLVMNRDEKTGQYTIRLVSDDEES
ncbi:MAG: OST-HTH/LOTUS domain-containing protein, partial [Oligoflexia bacterium]|nr:OST-HTH/LOTUS domain-containing protein [Oligoflexia bacterium]